MVEAKEFKAALYQQCLQQLNNKLKQLSQAFTDAREALTTEAKSTAGDKHETGRAMIQLEQEKLSRQYIETQKSRELLLRVPYDKAHNKVATGALVETGIGLFFIAVGLGELKLNDEAVFVIAPSSPLAQTMLGKTTGESFNFNHNSILIKAIY